MDLAARTVDLLAAALALGSSIWFFFIQSPVLLKRLGRERFVPIQMRLTVVLFRALSVFLTIMLVVTLVHSPVYSTATLSAVVAFGACLINRFLVVPKALRAGGQSVADIKGKDGEGSLVGFTSEGAGSRTKTMHRLVVLLVVLMLGGVAVHGFVLITY